MNCIVCGYGKNIRVWVRRVDGGRRRPAYFCDEDCKKKWFTGCVPKDLQETTAVLGFDVFIPVWEWEEGV